MTQFETSEVSQASGDRELIEAARNVREQAYDVYSHFPVGAAVRTRSGKIVVGCNVENASFGLTMCAERSAIFAAVASEGKQVGIEAIAIVADAPSCPPCGACRQVLSEFGRDIRVLFTEDDRPKVMTIEELMPVAFELGDKRL